jgi:hypothetical protein
MSPVDGKVPLASLYGSTKVNRGVSVAIFKNNLNYFVSGRPMTPIIDCESAPQRSPFL